jgi:hypothetical protein
VTQAQQLFREHLDRARLARGVVHRPRRAY